MPLYRSALDLGLLLTNFRFSCHSILRSRLLKLSLYFFGRDSISFKSERRPSCRIMEQNQIRDISVCIAFLETTRNGSALLDSLIYFCASGAKFCWDGDCCCRKALW